MMRMTRNMLTVVMMIVVIGLATAAQAATLSLSATAPTVDGLDIANGLGAGTGSEKFWTDTRAIGQTFTTGAADAILKAITLQANSPTTGDKVYTVVVGETSSNTYVSTVSETFSQIGVTVNAGDYFTATLDTPIALSAGTTYGFDFAMNSSTSGWSGNIPYMKTTSDTYAGGSQFRSTANKTSTSPFSFIGGDKVFHLDMEAAAQDGILHIYKFLDADGDGERGANELRLPEGMFQFAIEDAAGEPVIDPTTGEPLVVWNCLEDIPLPEGAYLAREINLTGDWYATSPNPLSFDIKAGETLELEFGNNVPEPATMALLSLAACGLGGYVRRRRKAL